MLISIRNNFHISNQKSSIKNHQSKIINQKSSIKNHQSKIINQKPSIKNHQSKIINQKPSIKNHQSKTINQKPSIKNHQSKTINQKPSIKNHQSKTINQKSSFSNHHSMNSFGRIFRISIYGESHGKSVGVIVDGCPAGLPLSLIDFEADLLRRRSGAKGTTPRKEQDLPTLISGVFDGKTTGAPLTVLFENSNTRSADYSNMVKHPRPGHADFVATRKFGGFGDFGGGGHFSGRLTLGLVAAGVIAKKIISPVVLNARIMEVGGNKNIDETIENAINTKDSVGGIIECRASAMPVGLGEPFFDAVESLISHMIFAIPAIKGIEFGSGFAAAKMRGSVHNDPIVSSDGTTTTNHSGGINGGITNGNDLVFRVAVKPTSSIGIAQQTFHFENNKVEELTITGRHDACIALRIPPVIECATAIVLADLMLLEQQISRIYKSF